MVWVFVLSAFFMIVFSPVIFCMRGLLFTYCKRGKKEKKRKVFAWEPGGFFFFFVCLFVCFCVEFDNFDWAARCFSFRSVPAAAMVSGDTLGHTYGGAPSIQFSFSHETSWMQAFLWPTRFIVIERFVHSSEGHRSSLVTGETMQIR